MVEHPTIIQLRKLVELNFCEKDKIAYKQLIEPGIRAILRDYWWDWNEIEWQITIMVMKLEGVFKKENDIIIAFNSAEEAQRYSDEVNVELFKRIEEKRFKWKIDYLHKKGILYDNAYRLLDILRAKRNKIHRPLARFSEQDLVEFSYGSRIVHDLWHTIFHKLDSNTIETARENIEKQAKLYLSLIKF